MINKLSQTEERYRKIESELANGEVMADIELYKKLMKEYSSLQPVVEKFREYKACVSSIDEAREMMESESDSELHALALDEYRDGKDRLTVIENELKALLLPRDPLDERSVVVEIRAGAGGDEAALFAGVLYRMYTMYAETKRFKTELVSANETGLGGFREITFTVNGDGAYSRFKFESGVHRVQRVPETESSGRIHTSTATVAVLPEADDVEIEINPADITVESCKSSGAGGQHINKTESAVRITHKPSGIVVECQEERSQFKNKDKAMKLLKTKLYDIKLREQNEKIASARRSQVGTGDRSERIRTYNYSQSRVTDHRIGLTVHSLEAFLNGELDEMIDALATAEAAERLKGGADDEN